MPEWDQIRYQAWKYVQKRKKSYKTQKNSNITVTEQFRGLCIEYLEGNQDGLHSTTKLSFGEIKIPKNIEWR